MIVENPLCWSRDYRGHVLHKSLVQGVQYLEAFAVSVDHRRINGIRTRPRHSLQAGFA